VNIHTLYGGSIDLLSMTPEDVDIRDIAHALSHICRFAGNSRSFYSVAQHSVLVARRLPERLRLAGLLHDSAEAYTGDIISPIKYSIAPRYENLEARILQVIGRKFCVSLTPMHPWVHEVDKRTGATELRDLIGDFDDCEILPYPFQHITPVGPHEAREMFMDAFVEMVGW